MHAIDADLAEMENLALSEPNRRRMLDGIADAVREVEAAETTAIAALRSAVAD